MSLSIILPAKNEKDGLAEVLPKLQNLFPTAEIIVVDDGSTDSTATIAKSGGAHVIQHPQSLGNGAAVKQGARSATGEIAVFMDSDGQHDPADISALLAKLDQGYDMVVGARISNTHTSWLRRLGNGFYNRLASFMTGHNIQDLTSGFRAVRLRKFKQFLYLLPNGFSYPTTSTMAFFRSGYPVAYVPIKAASRQGSKSSIRVVKDGMRFFIIVLKVGALYSPMRLFLPVSFFFFSVGLLYYGYTFITAHRFTNMSALLFITSMTTFLIGIVSEQVSSLHYRNFEKDN
ncbi:glycosyltransferase family 2 protein [Aquisalimonas lutea]|uniref:glycosyltransferase family 2 protein n=1 Tax=Aquisalimonas lutea TaxID=1327750 RepID=UPI0025B474F7|nr:glycosyltransferase family 2 protein [Aquisalimonas lutea]MDN3516003.1 glycosyltransferase family 2 protein [Aquisalimonas lutea]